MKITLEKSVLLNALSHSQSVVERKTTIPILSHVLFTAGAHGLSLTTTDMDLALIETIQADVETPGAATVSAHLVYEIVRKLSDNKPVSIELNSEQSQLHIASGRSKFQLSCLSPDDFPQITQSTLSHHFDLPGPVLRHLIDTTRFSMSTEETRYHLNGIYFHCTQQGDDLVLRAVATDLHRLASAQCQAPADAAGMPDIIVGRKAISEIRRLLEGVDLPVQMGVSDGRIEVSFQNAHSRAVISARLIDGAFPDYEAALVVENDKRMLVNTKSFAQSVDRVGTIVGEKVRAIRIMLQNNVAHFSAVSSDFGSATEELDVDFPEQESVEICFNVKYLMDIATQIDTEEMELLLADSDSSVLVRPKDDQHSIFVLMPLRL